MIWWIDTGCLREHCFMARFELPMRGIVDWVLIEVAVW